MAAVCAVGYLLGIRVSQRSGEVVCVAVRLWFEVVGERGKGNQLQVKRISELSNRTCHRPDRGIFIGGKSEGGRGPRIGVAGPWGIFQASRPSLFSAGP